MNFSVSIEPDETGYTGKECPTCERYFKIVLGTGLADATDCYCPYCNHFGPHDEFWTKNQIEYAKTVALNKISSDLLRTMKKMEVKPNKKAFLSIGISVKGKPVPITHYSEKELEEGLTCNQCNLEYAIFGAFAYCPDCGVHNSQQIVNANFDFVQRILNLAINADDDIRVNLVENALEDTVSALDGFGREHCKSLGYRMSFQNIESARVALLEKEGVNIAFELDTRSWSFVCEQFQKRHVLAHKMGVIDEEFIRKTASEKSLLGRKLSVTDEDVRELITYLRLVVRNLYEGVTRK